LASDEAYLLLQESTNGSMPGPMVVTEVQQKPHRTYHLLKNSIETSLVVHVTKGNFQCILCSINKVKIFLSDSVTVVSIDVLFLMSTFLHRILGPVDVI
jgi:hypothetical protein